MSLHVLRGMHDILPPEIHLWQEVESKARDWYHRYGYEEVRPPVLEDMSVFTRSVGETTNIVEKEMYVFQDRNGKWVALRPEGTASVVRAYVENNLSQEDPLARLYYMGPMYRYEKPQKGRYRQFHQLGAEVFGVASPRLDADVIHMLDLFLKDLGVPDLEIEINSLGCTVCRPNFLRAFFDFLHRNEDKLCPECRRRMERNPLRALDCKEAGCQTLTAEGPSIQEALCDTCEKDFDTVLETLGHLGSTYRVNPKIVRGLDYYLKTTFEITTTKLGAQGAVAGGGRYDGLVRLMGGQNIPGFGFAVGMERLIELLRLVRGEPDASRREGVFIAIMGDKALLEGMKIAQSLRASGHMVDLDYEGRSLKSQLRRADRERARFVVFLGEDELKKHRVGVKDMLSGEQQEMDIQSLAKSLTNQKT